MHNQAPGLPTAAAARGARGGVTRMKNPLKPPRFSKNMNGATQSQVRPLSPPSPYCAQLNLFQDNPSLTQGGTISQPYPVSQSGLMSQHAYGLSQQDFSQPVLTHPTAFLVTRCRSSLFSSRRICTMYINRRRTNIISSCRKILPMLTQLLSLTLKFPTIPIVMER